MAEPYVWARTSPGKQKRVLRSVAEAEGWEIVRKRSRGFSSATNRVHMSPEERREIYLKTGEHVSDRNEMHAMLRRKGIRHAEQGEGCNDRFDALKDSAEGSGKDSCLDLEHVDLFGLHEANSRRKPFDAQERFRYHCGRLGISPTEDS